MGNRLSLLLLLLCILLGGVIYFETRPENQLQMPLSISITSDKGDPSRGADSLGPPAIADLADLTETLDRPLFSATRRPVASGEATALVVDTPAPAAAGIPALELSAVIINGAQRLALLQRPDPQAALLHVQEGHSVDGWLLTEILPDRVVLSRAGQEHELVLRKFKPPPAALLPAKKPQLPRSAPGTGARLNTEVLDLRRPRRALRGPRLRSQQRNSKK